MELHDSVDYVSPKTRFKCFFCNEIHYPENGVVLKECIHSLCKTCIHIIVFNSTEAEIMCPYNGDSQEGYLCQSEITQREIRGILSKVDYDTYLNRSLKLMTDKINKSTEDKIAYYNGLGQFRKNQILKVRRLIHTNY